MSSKQLRTKHLAEEEYQHHAYRRISCMLRNTYLKAPGRRILPCLSEAFPNRSDHPRSGCDFRYLTFEVFEYLTFRLFWKSGCEILYPTVQDFLTTHTALLELELYVGIRWSIGNYQMHNWKLSAAIFQCVRRDISADNNHDVISTPVIIHRQFRRLWKLWDCVEVYPRLRLKIWARNLSCREQKSAPRWHRRQNLKHSSWNTNSFVACISNEANSFVILIYRVLYCLQANHRGSLGSDNWANCEKCGSG